MNSRVLFSLVVAAVSLNVLVGNSQDPEYRQPTREEKLAAALELMAKGFNAALVTVDSEGQPRARTVEPFSPEDDWTIWVATNPLPRKVAQIADNKVTLYYDDDATGSYLVIMGTATIHDDPESKARF